MTEPNYHREFTRVPVHIWGTFTNEAGEELLTAEINNLSELGQALAHYNARQLSADPFFLAVIGGFHGKTSGAVKLTHSPEFRTPWHSFGIRGEFVSRNDEAHLQQISQSATLTTYQLALADDGWLYWHESKSSRLGALIAEPIQGEGGIHERPPSFMQVLRAGAASADHETAPLRLDVDAHRAGPDFSVERRGAASDIDVPVAPAAVVGLPRRGFEADAELPRKAFALHRGRSAGRGAGIRVLVAVAAV